MRIEPDGCDLVTIKVSTANLPSTIGDIGNKWKMLIPSRPFSYFFLDEYFDKQYRSEERFGKLFLDFAVLAIFISCLGLLGLASYSTLQRTKEIGIRKVMGASVSNIVNLLSRDFLKLVGLRGRPPDSSTNRLADRQFSGGQVGHYQSRKEFKK